MSDTESTTTLNLTVNLASADAEMRVRVNRITAFVGASLASAESLRDPIPNVGGGLVAISLPETVTADTIRTDYRRWALRAGFRDIADAISHLLEEYYQAALVWSVVQPGGKLQTWGEWIARFIEPKVKFNRLTLPEKLAAFEKLGVVPDARDLKRLKAINAVRNCLVHRQGRVESKDTDASGSLRLIGAKFAVFIHRHGGGVEEVTSLPVDVAAGERCESKEIEFARAFPLGSQVDIDAEAFSAAGLALILAGMRLRDTMATHGKKLGHLT